MKKICAAFFILGSIMIFVLAGAGIGGGGEKDFLRLHIRANSNSDADQQVKYLVKQKIVDELTPVFAGVTTKKQAIDKLAENLEYIEQTANEVLFANGFNYSSRAAIKSELFPTRKYTTGQGFDTVLPEGIYDALILELGAGTGDNWWCVVYPPLCFLENNIGGDSGVKYRSKIQEIIKRYF